MNQKTLIVGVIILLIVVVIFCYDDSVEGYDNTYDRYDMPSAANLDLVVRKAANEIASVTTEFVVTPCMSGPLHTLDNKIDCIVNYRNYYREILRDHLSEMFYYLMQLGHNPFRQTVYGPKQREEHRALAMMVDAYSLALTRAVRIMKSKYEENGYDDGVFEHILFKLLHSSFGVTLHKIYVMNYNDSEETTKGTAVETIEERDPVESTEEQIVRDNTTEGLMAESEQKRDISQTNGAATNNEKNDATIQSVEQTGQVLDLTCDDLNSGKIQLFIDGEPVQCGDLQN